MHGLDFHHLFRSATCSPRLLRPLHALLLVSGHCPNDIIFSTRLVNLYSRLGDTASSLLTFQQMPTKNIFAWNTMLTTYVRNGLFPDAVHCFYRFVVWSLDRRNVTLGNGINHRKGGGRNSQQCNGYEQEDNNSATGIRHAGENSRAAATCRA